MWLIPILMHPDFAKSEKKRRVLHTLEYLAEQLYGRNWNRKFRKLLRDGKALDGLRRINMADLSWIQLSEAETKDGDDEQ